MRHCIGCGKYAILLIMDLKLNREFLQRHLFVVLLMFGLGCWFGYDGYIRYPKTDAAVLYKSIEGNEAPAGTDLAAFKAQKTKTQHGFCLLAFLASLVIGLDLVRLSRIKFSFDETGFSSNGKRYAYSDITNVDRSQWEKKGILVIHVDQTSIKLDAWHHTGVKEFSAKLPFPRQTAEG